jgi:hypothetical protein
MRPTRPPSTRSPRHVRAARARWGAQRIVRIDELDADTARLIRALIANAEAEPAADEKDHDDGPVAA